MNQRNESLGFTEKVLAEASPFESYYVGRIISQKQKLYEIALLEGTIHGEVTGKMRYEAMDPADFPVVGDFVMVDRKDETHGYAVIHEILTRKSLFVRKVAGKRRDAQAVAANVDTVFLCMALNENFNLRRLERYFAVALESGAVPVIVLTKGDLAENLPEKLSEVEKITLGYEVIVTSSLTGEGVEKLRPYAEKGKTVAFLGSSGVGKSSLINSLLGSSVMETKATGYEDKGRHTTTHRELLLLENGGALIDTPGMRELGILEADFSKSFEDIYALAESCRFRDCSHVSEPHCAVKKAVEEGALPVERYENFLKLREEVPNYEGLNSREIEKKKLDRMFGGKKEMKKTKDQVKKKNKYQFRD
ncbi:MAG TPA: ribosome small subunit-dependent GTPase A [Proteiniclasticum sp.]|uniref:ribosome small subunit-dependent GTPase A n=1 Tax=Proteiniclasticum sp. TaxID=2053595 RepID=UPI000E969CE9|nr:ribosome small subunit-dependent GTPase A [Proteiniclasticum sp.]HBW13632.1 ribosome small subunit-dependent GTPase A [Proteiniclasticum sp.]